SPLHLLPHRKRWDTRSKPRGRNRSASPFPVPPEPLLHPAKQNLSPPVPALYSLHSLDSDRRNSQKKRSRHFLFCRLREASGPYGLWPRTSPLLSSEAGSWIRPPLPAHSGFPLQWNPFCRSGPPPVPWRLPYLRSSPENGYCRFHRRSLTAGPYC